MRVVSGTALSIDHTAQLTALVNKQQKSARVQTQAEIELLLGKTTRKPEVNCRGFIASRVAFGKRLIVVAHVGQLQRYLVEVVRHDRGELQIGVDLAHLVGYLSYLVQSGDQRHQD